MVFQHSRYVNSKVYPRAFRGANRTTLTLRLIDREIPSDSVIHIVTEMDRIDNLSYRYYGSPDFWWWIADKNPEVDPFDLPVGAQLWIAPLENRL